MRIGVDLDGVCADFMLGFSEISSKIFGTHTVTDREQVTHWDLQEVFGISEEQIHVVWNEINSSNNFWRTLKPWDRKSFNYFKNAFNGEEVYFITARIRGKNIYKQTVSWLDSVGWINPQVIITVDKVPIIQYLGLDYFVDDRLETCHDISATTNCKAIIYDYPHNRINKTLTRVSNLREYTDILLKRTQ